MLTLNLDERSDVPSGGTEGVVIRVAFPFSSRPPVLVLLGSMHHSLVNGAILTATQVTFSAVTFPAPRAGQ